MVVEPGSLLGACDVLLITATDRETTALKAALGAVSSAEPSILRGRRKTYTDHGQIAGTRVVRVRCEMGAGAPGGASSTVSDAIHEVAPRAIIMVGIAFGAKGKARQRLGTILVSQQLQDYELQRVGTGLEGEAVITPRGDRVSASPRLVDRLRHARESWTAKEPVAFGLVLSGDKLVDNIDFLKTLKERFPEAIGGEMEGRGLYVEAKDRAEWILVKAVCDWADGNKRKNKARNQKKAAEAAAGFVVHALLQGGLGSGPLHKPGAVSSRTGPGSGDDRSRLSENGDSPPSSAGPLEVEPTPTGSEPPTRVFISYSHDTPAHVEAVTALANQLCAAGVDAWIDRYVVSPPEGWPRWMRGQILKADVVLMVCTKTYRERFEGEGAGGEGPNADAPGKGVVWEGLIATAMLYANRGRNRHFVPVLLGGTSVEHIPVELQGASIFRLPEDFAGLLRRIRGRPPVDRPVVGGGHADSGERPASKGVDRPVRSNGVPSRMNERGAPPVEPGPSKEAMRDLVDFLTHRFSEQSLHEMGFFYGGSKVSAELPGGTAPLRSLAYALARELWRHGLIDAEFFRYLEEQRPNLRADVLRIQVAFGVGPAVTDEQSSEAGERPQVAEVPEESTLLRGVSRSEPAQGEPAQGESARSELARREGGQREPYQSERRATVEPKGSEAPENPGENRASSGAGSVHPQHSRVPWTADELKDELVDLLEQAPKLLSRLRDLLVPVAGEDSDLAAPDLIARRIIALGSGVASARKLVEVCFKAVLTGKDPRKGEADIACDLICRWLPFGYPEVDHVVVLRLDTSPETYRNLQVRTMRPMIVDVHMARIDGRHCEFTVSRVADPRGGTHVPQSMLPLPPASSERIGAEEVAQLVIDAVCERFQIGGEQRALDARTRIEAECIKDRSPYIVVKPTVREKSFSDVAIRALNAKFPELHVVILSAADASQKDDESRIWTMLTDLLKAREN